MEVILNSILAGVWIGIASMVSLNADTILAPFLFAIGLLVILEQKYFLFTGQAGRKDILKQPLFLFKVWIGNLLGTASVLFFFNSSIEEKIIPLVDKKLLNSIPLILLKAIFCGLLMYIATQVVKDKLSIILCVASFIIAGFEHSIADMAYIWLYLRARHVFDARIPIFILVVSIGNMVGAQIMRIADTYRN